MKHPAFYVVSCIEHPPCSDPYYLDKARAAPPCFPQSASCPPFSECLNNSSPPYALASIIRAHHASQMEENCLNATRVLQRVRAQETIALNLKAGPSLKEGVRALRLLGVLVRVFLDA